MTTLTDLAPSARPAAGTRHSGATPDPQQRRRHGRGFWVVGYVFAVTMAFSTIPAPLYVLYQARDHFGALLVTVIFAAYAVGVMASLFLAGHVSDWLGRRRMVATAVGVNMLSGIVFLAWPTVPGLITGRVISGISIGMLTATATAYLSELHAAARPGQPGRRAEVVATAANLGGLGLGALLAGLLAQYAGHRLQLPFLVSEALMAGGALALAATPETVARPAPRPRYHPQRFSVPAADRSAFFAAGLAAVAAFALFGLFTSLAPGFIAGTLGDRSHALAGVATFVVFGAAALAQVAVSRAATSRQLRTGLAALTLGLALVTIAVWLPSLTVFLLGGALAGAGAGAAFKGSISTVIAIAPAARRGETLAGLFLAAYLAPRCRSSASAWPPSSSAPRPRCSASPQSCWLSRWQPAASWRPGGPRRTAARRRSRRSSLSRSPPASRATPSSPGWRPRDRRRDQHGLLRRPVSDTGGPTGRGNPYLRGSITGAGTFAGGVLHTLPFLIPQYRAAIAVAVVVICPGAPGAGLDPLAFFGTGLVRSFVSIALGGAIIASVSAALGAVS